METVIANISQQEEIVRDVWMGTMMNLGDLHTRTSSTFAEVRISTTYTISS